MALSSFVERRGSVGDAPDHYMMSATWFPSVDWRETTTAHVIEADVRGLRKEDVQVQVEEGRTLRIVGNRKNEEENNATEKDSWHRAERRRGAILRRFTIPEDVNPDRIAAKVEHGVLTKVVSKLQKMKELQVRKIHVASKL